MGDASVVDELMTDAWPPQVVERDRSWRHRWASGVTRRANSVQAIGEVEESIARAERFYKARDPSAVPGLHRVDAEVAGR